MPPTYQIVPEGAECKLAECRPGFYRHGEMIELLFYRYNPGDKVARTFNIATGAHFRGRNLLVQPVSLLPVSETQEVPPAAVDVSALQSPNPVYAKCGPVSCDEAMEILKRFCNSHFDTKGDKARASIPADPNRDDDLRLGAFIEQTLVLQSRLEAAEKRAEEAEAVNVRVAASVAQTPLVSLSNPRDLEKIKAIEEENGKLRDAGEMLQVMLCNVSGGDWTKQSEEWQTYARKWLDNWRAALSPSSTPSATPAVTQEQIRTRYVAGFYVDPARRTVALVEKQKPAWQKGRLNAIGGKIEEGETPEAAMIREFAEETGVCTTEWRPTVVLFGPKFEVHFFVNFGDPTKCRQMESERVVVESVDALPETCIPNLHWLLPLSLDPELKVPIHIEDISDDPAKAAARNLEIALAPAAAKASPAKSIVRQNAEKDTTYTPYCLRCPGLIRMGKVAEFRWQCHRCGAAHDERNAPSATPAATEKISTEQTPQRSALAPLSDAYAANVSNARLASPSRTATSEDIQTDAAIGSSAHPGCSSSAGSSMPCPTIEPSKPLGETSERGGSTGVHKSETAGVCSVDSLTPAATAERDVVEAKECVAHNTCPPIVCLCGFTRFYREFQRANYEETMAGRIVLSVGFVPDKPVSITEALSSYSPIHRSMLPKQTHGEDVGCTPEQKLALDELHKRKIDLCDEVLVLNVGGYIGKSTTSEIQYAVKIGKPVRWLESPSDALLTLTKSETKSDVKGNV